MMRSQSSLPVGAIWALPFSRVDGNKLRARRAVPQSRPRAPQNLLDRFCKIAEAPDTERAAIKFVSRWGLLGLCEHGLPASHGCGKVSDTIDAYKAFATCLDAMARVGSELNQGNVGTNLDWELADSVLCGPDFPPWSSEMRRRTLGDLALARSHFQTLMRRLTDVTHLRPRFCWSGGSWAIDFDSERLPNIPAILTIQLMAKIGGKAMRKCRDCPRWFTPIRRQVYCDLCGIHAAWRHAAARQREFKSLAKSLARSQAKKKKRRSS